MGIFWFVDLYKTKQRAVETTDDSNWLYYWQMMNLQMTVISMQKSTPMIKKKHAINRVFQHWEKLP